VRFALILVCLTTVSCDQERSSFLRVPGDIDWVARLSVTGAQRPLAADNLVFATGLEPAHLAATELLKLDIIALGWSAEQLDSTPSSSDRLYVPAAEDPHRSLPEPAWRAAITASGDILEGEPSSLPALTSDGQPNEPSWSQIATSSAPSPRYRFGLAYDAAGERQILYGGSASMGRLGDTWSFKDDQWTCIETSTSPEARSLPALAFDQAGERVILFAGFNDVDRELADTWALSGGDWHELPSSPAPPARAGHALVWDRARERIVLFGGARGGDLLSDTWELVGDRWEEVTTESAPEPRRDFGIFFDSGRGTVVVLGGLGASGPLRDAWEYDGSWRPAHALALPEVRSSFAVAYWEPEGQVILQGGLTSLGSRSDETWLFDRAWRRLHRAGPGAREMHSAAFDAARSRLVLFGGRRGFVQTLGDTYALTWLGR
jgi:hypothetical protein